MKEKFKLTSLEKSWILYDIGNSAFILLVSTLLPIYFNALASGAGISESDYLAYWGYAGSVATILVAIIGPICGTMADWNYKKPLFLGSLALGAIGCAALGVAWGWLSFLVIFIIARVGYNCANVFYDSMLPEITTEARMDNVSTMGYALGYIGSVIPFALCLVLVLLHDTFGMSQVTALIISFILTAVWWVVCSVPLAKRYKQTAFHENGGKPVGESFKQLARTFKEAKKHKHIFVYLVAFFFFIDGVYTIIDMATAYGSALGLDSTGLLLALLVTQIVAFPFAILFGRLAKNHSSEKLISICIMAYFGIAVFAIFLQHQWQFWTLAVLVGMFQGGIQALSRSYFTKIIPAEQSGEYFGLLDICGKGAAFLGTTIVSVVSQITGSMSTGVGMIALLFVIGFVLFRMAAKAPETVRK